eukprot:5564548-Prymnesium_polylepis.1
MVRSGHAYKSPGPGPQNHAREPVLATTAKASHAVRPRGPASAVRRRSRLLSRTGLLLCLCEPLLLERTRQLAATAQADEAADKPDRGEHAHHGGP